MTSTVTPMLTQKDAGFTVRFPSHRPDRSVIVDDDGRTGYAYIASPREWLADVWLYNRMPAPEEPEWSFRPPDPPFLNPRSLCQNESLFPLPVSDDPLRVESFDHRQGFGAFIFIYGCLAGLVLDNYKPGWATMAKASGPLARSFQGLLPKKEELPRMSVWAHLVGSARAAHGLPAGAASEERPSIGELAWVADLVLACAH